MTEMPAVEVLLAQRREGRTTQLMLWLTKGHRIDTYPGWSRILVCAHQRAVQDLVLAAGPVGENPWRKCIFTLRDLESASLGAIRPGTVEYAIDDARATVVADAADSGRIACADQLHRRAIRARGDSVRWTLIRHRMLHAVSTGRVHESPDGQRWVIQSTCSTHVEMARALNSMWDAGLTAAVVDVDRTIVPSEEGVRMLSKWDTEHGMVTS